MPGHIAGTGSASLPGPRGAMVTPMSRVPKRVRHGPVYLSVELPFDTSVASVARREVTAVLGSEEQVGSISLVCSELVTNSFRHGSPPILLKMQIDRTERYPAVELTVTDGGAAAEPRHTGGEKSDDESGRGHQIVEALAASFFLHVGACCTTAWCRLPLAEPSALGVSAPRRDQKESHHGN